MRRERWTQRRLVSAVSEAMVTVATEGGVVEVEEGVVVEATTEEEEGMYQ